ncbi:uncharacterized protein LOC21388498 isoform X1 [Morus notabilis]|uniref:uncharacterized protein LOC21388498 isoform X1 n=1 Tax=Morus notabilis TaxID=981085 RepID=UPI000CED728B|nr:uncharacterized protein LOC21388498 isoform X1 [Morus notabilis]
MYNLASSSIGFMALLFGSFLVSLSSLLSTFLRLLNKVLFRYVRDDSSKVNILLPQETDRIGSSDSVIENPEVMRIQKSCSEISRVEDSKGSEDFEGKESSKEPKFVFTFKFPTYEEFTSNLTENNGGFASSGSSFFVEEEEIVSSFSAKSQSSSNEEISHSEFLSEKDFVEEIVENSRSGKGKLQSQETEYENFLSESTNMASDSDSDSITSSREFSFITRFMDSTSDDFLSDVDFEGFSEVGTLVNEKNSEFSDREDEEEEEEEDEGILEELRKLEKSEENLCETEPNEEDSSEKSNGFEDSNDLETLWEHQELLEQLKMELRKVRATGLPTILEESESPKITEDLKPWKIDEKFHHGDRLSELHKFYKSYRERMRKFDILNYQKMYALGFLQSKDPLRAFSSQKSSTLWGYKRKKSESDQMEKFGRELKSDLEMVYVGQLCLSWEFLQWQYDKIFEIWDSDPYGLRQYNEVAGEFQQFQVLLQRFIENEPFQGPRVENYVKNRCIMRNLLQVPVIREDSKERKKARKGGRENGGITSDMILEILEESIRTIWRFIRADKYAHNLVPKSRREMDIELQDPVDSELLLEVQTELQKKDKKLKDLLRSGNCILKKLRKHQEDGSDHLHFFSQVDLRLVSRVLNMSRITTDQLVWCHNKLSKRIQKKERKQEKEGEKMVELQVT